MSTADDMLTVERRIGRVRAILIAIQCVAANADQGIAVDSFCHDFELIAQEEMTKVVGVLGTEVLDRYC